MSSYIVSSFSDIRYTVVRLSSDGPTPDLPAPSTVPDVAADKVPDRHRGPTSPDGSHQIVIRRRGERCPFADSDVECDWIEVDEIREHRRKNPDIWQTEEEL